MLEHIDGRGHSTPVHIQRPTPVGRRGEPHDAVARIVQDVRLRGDDAVIELTRELDRATLTPETLRVTPVEIDKARSLVRPAVIDALEVMTERVRSTCERQVPQGWLEERDGELVGEVVRPLRRVGVYVPGGRAAYPSSVVMSVVPAQVAGVESIAIATPCAPDGSVSEAVLAACSVLGVEEVYRIGGAQAIAALAYGTRNVRPVEKIVGPGNVYVTLAKRAVQGWVGIDSEAGPSEIAIIADESADAAAMAADLVAQAEHGPLGTHVLITWSERLLADVEAELERQVLAHPRSDDVENALIEGGRAVLVDDLDQAMTTANAFAPEHLEIAVDDAREALERVQNAGAVFIGGSTPVAMGDYVAGTNHVLPTGGAARFASGLSVRDFVKWTYVCGLDRAALARLSPHAKALAEAEGLHAHARSLTTRLRN